MDEFRLDKDYKPGDMMLDNLSFKYDSHPLIGKLSTDRCPQCAAKTYISNSKEYQWCWNCDWEIP